MDNRAGRAERPPTSNTRQERIITTLLETTGTSSTTPRDFTSRLASEALNLSRNETPQNAGALLLPVFDASVVRLTEGGSDAGVYGGIASSIARELIARGYRPDMFTTQRVDGRLAQFQPDLLRMRAAALNRDTQGLSDNDLIDLVYGDIAIRTFPVPSANERTSTARTEEQRRDLNSEYYSSDPQLDRFRDLRVGDLGLIDVVQRYDTLIDQGVQNTQITANDSAYQVSPELQTQLNAISGLVTSETPQPLRESVSELFSPRGAIQRALARVEFRTILANENPYVILNVNDQTRELLEGIDRTEGLDAIQKKQQKESLLRGDWRNLMRRWHTDRNRQGAATEISRKINVAYQSLTAS